MPADRSVERESELAPLFAGLVETEQKAEEIRQRVAAEAGRVRTDARAEAGGRGASALRRTKEVTS